MSLRIMRLHTLSTLLAAGLLVGVACRGAGFFDPTLCDYDNDASAGVQGFFTKTSGDGKSAQAGAQIYLVVHLVDVDNENLCQKTITWTPGANSGSVSPGQSVTDDESAFAASVWTLGPAAGTQTVTATVQNSIPTLSVVFTATATAPGLHQLAIVSGDQQTAPGATAVPQPLVVKFIDALGNPGPATVLTWQDAGGGGSLAQGTTTTDAAGLSNNTWFLGPLGAQAVTVSESGGSSVVFTATATPSNYTLVLVSGENQSAPERTLLPRPLVIKLTDPQGNPGPVSKLTWSVDNGGGTLTQATTTTDPVTGLSQNTWTLGPEAAGTQIVHVAWQGGMFGSSVQFLATATPLGGSHPKAKISAYNNTTTPDLFVVLQTPYDGQRTLGPILPNTAVSDSLQVEVGVPFTISSTIGGVTGTVTCTTTAAIIPNPADPVNTGNALVAVGTGPTLTCTGNGWH